MITYTKRAKLASLAGFDVEVKLSQYVPKDTNFSLWLNVARSKMYGNKIIILFETLKVCNILKMREYTD
jgi:hypothetical protein